MSDLLSLVHATYAAINAGDLDSVRSYVSDDVETLTPGGLTHGFEPWKALGETFLAACPDMRHEIVRSYEIDDTIVVEGVFSGTHTGPLVMEAGTIPPSGNAFAFPYADFFTVDESNKVTSHRVYWDNVTFLSQIGAMPAA